MFSRWRLAEIRNADSRSSLSRKFSGLAVALLICSDCYFVLDKFAPSTVPTIQRAWARWRIEQFVEPPDRIVFEAAATTHPGLDAAHGYIQQPVTVNSDESVVYSALASEREAEFKLAESTWRQIRNVSEVSEGTGYFGIGAGSRGLMANAVVFAHEFRLPSGERRLLFLDVYFNERSVVELDARLFTVGDNSAASSQVSTSMFCVRSREESNSFRLYAPQPDPGNFSRFTIAYETSGGYGTIEGRLTGSDGVSWEILNGPASDASIAPE